MEQRKLRSINRSLAITLWLVVLAMPSAAQETAARKTGAVKSISGNSIVLKLDSGQEVNVTVEDGARILRVNPGQTDLKSAATITLSDIAAGDRMLVRGKPGDNPDSLTASTVMVMKQADVAQKQQKERQDWQRRGAGGIVSAIDPATGVITVSVTPTQSAVIKTGKDTSFLRYARNSVKFEDAQQSTFSDIKVGDQLRARGTRSGDGKELTADEVISGTFRNIAGTISAIDSETSTLTVKDVIGKKTVKVKLTDESQMRKLPQQLAQRIAFFLKSPEAAQQAMAARPAGAGGAGTGAFPGGGSTGAFGGGGAVGGSGRPNGPPDFQQMINRLPAVKLADLQKEEAVMIVSTPGTGGSEVTAITLLSGVESILTSNATGGAALLSGWNLSAPAEAQ
jgi:hypothetical protein